MSAPEVEPVPLDPIEEEPDDPPEEEDDELLEDDDCELEDEDDEPNRLVEALMADDIPELEPELLDDDKEDEDVRPALELTDAVGLPPPAPPRSPRPKPERLPRSCGAMSEAKFSAAVAPVKRTVVSRTPVVTVAVLTVAAAV